MEKGGRSLRSKAYISLRVEVWDGSWSFIGAAEYDARGMNRCCTYPRGSPRVVKHIDVLMPSLASSSSLLSFLRTWFYPEPARGQVEGDRMHAIYASSYRPTGTSFVLAWNLSATWVPAEDVTRHYTLESPADEPRSVF